jgi:hypothetical protein
VPKSLAELKSSPDVGLPEYTVKVHVSAKLVGALEAADLALYNADREAAEARAALEAARERDADSDAPAPPRRSGQSPHADLVQRVEAAESAAEGAARASDEIRARMEVVEVLLRGTGSGEWRRWANAHPARDEESDRAGALRDQRYAAGYCDLDALVADLHLWVAECNGEAASEEWWEFLSTNGLPADLTAAASRVVQMHEQGVDLGKDRERWLADRRSATASR